MQHPNSIEFFLLIIGAMFCGLAVRFALGYAKQTWAMTYHHTMSYALLPAVNYGYNDFNIWKYCSFTWNDRGFVNCSISKSSTSITQAIWH